MRSDKDKRTETEKDIDDFLSKFESPSDGSAADYSTYLENEETAASNGPSFNWKDVESDDLTQESGSIAETAKNAEADNEKKTDKISQDKKAPKKNGKKQNSIPARITAQDKEEIKKEIREELEEDLKEEVKEEVKEDVKEEVKEPAPYKAGRKKRRNKDVRKTSLSNDTDSPAPEEKSFDDHKNDTEKALIEIKEISVVSEDKEDPVEDKEPEINEDLFKDNVSEETEDLAEDKKAEKTEDPAEEKTEDKEDKTEDLTEDIEIENEKPESAASRDIEDVAKAVLVSGAGSDMSKYGKNKKRSGRKKSAKKKTYNDKKPVSPVEREVRTDKSPSRDDAVREVIKDTSTADKETKPDAGKQSGNELFSFSRKKSDSKKADAKKNKVKKPGSKLKDSALLKKTSGLTRKLKKRKGNRTLKEFLFLKPNPDYDPSKGDTYEKDGRTVKNKKNKVSFLKILGNIAAVFLVFVLAGMIYALGCIISAPKYDYKDIYSAVDTASVIYDDQGELIDNVFYTENRKIIKYEDMPEDLVNSFIAIEDKTFWKHHGFNWTRMIGAIISSLTGNGKISGTSTITQQLARNVYLADTKSVRSIKRKLLEMYYAGRLEHALTKEQIVEAYLNTIYLGHGCYGVNAAARTYFSKDVQDLDLIECASLAALPQSPDTYALLKLSSEAQDAVDPKVVATEPDTIVTNDIAKGRRQLTLDLMLEQGMISQAEHDKVYGLSLNDFINPTINKAGSDYSYFHEYLVETIINDLMEQRKMTYEDAERMVYTRGLQIYSTIDSTAQKVIVEEFKDDSNFPYVDPPRDGDGNMLNSDGEIAMYNYDNDFDENGNFRLSGEAGDVRVNSDGSVTVNKGKKLHIYETEVEDGTDYSLEFKSYYLYDDEDNLYSISGGYINIPMGYKSLDSGGNVIISADYFSDPTYSSNVDIDGNDVIFMPGSYSLSTKSRQPQAAMTIVGVGTGEVKAMVGGRTAGGQKLLNRSLNPRQPGSSIKPLAVYGAALQKSFELNKEGKKWKFTDFGIDKQGTKGWGDYLTCYSSVEDERLRIEGRYWPNNFSKSFSGKNNFITAIQHSINTCAVKILLQVGADYSVNQLKKFGITTVQDDTSNPVNDVNPAALALGAMTEGVEPLEMALAYASFPGGGKVNSPICYYKVLDRNGEVLLEGKSEQTEALDEGVAWIMTNVLQSVVSSNGYMYVEGVSPGGKTGTTNDEYDIWFDGFTPTYAGSLWIGTDENVDMNTTSTPAARLWGRIMNQIPAAKTGEYREQPSNVIYTSGCYFTEGTETGLTSWSDAEARRKAREKAKQAAYEKWLQERENHKKKVIDQPAGTRKELVSPEQFHWEDDHSRPIYSPPTVDDPSRPIRNEKGEIIGYEQMPNTNPADITGYEQKKVIDKEAVYKDVPVPEISHEEYEEGWRDGDFSFDDD